MTAALERRRLPSLAPAVGVTSKKEEIIMTRKLSPAERGETFQVPLPPLFDHGQIVATPGALAAGSTDYLRQCLGRHLHADWGIVCDDDRRSNFEALLAGGRILSAYPIDPAKPCKGYGDNTLWVITEADRSVTTFLLPGEY
jgi:hypothetical protein